MILGLSISQFIALHVAISFIAIAAGLVAMPAFAARRRVPGMMSLFLVTTMLTSFTGFLFPFRGFTPALGTGIVSTIVLIIAFVAYYGYRLRGRSGIVYAVSATAALWLNLFVLVVQSFLKVPALNVLAPTGTELPFALTQGALLIVMIGLGWIAVQSVRKGTAAPA